MIYIDLWWLKVCFISRDTSNRIEIYSDYIVVAGELNAPSIGCSTEEYVGTNVVYDRDKVIYGLGFASIDREIKTKTIPLGGRGYW